MDDLSKYLEFLFGGLEGYVYAPVKTDTRFEQKFFAWPDNRQALQDWIQTSDRDPSSHVYVSPVVYNKPGAKKPDVKACQVVWVDFDGEQKQVDFRDLEVPAALVQSSLSTKFHCYWKIPPTSGEVVEDTNRRLTYYLDADPSGWDLTQLLRPPTTTNRKYETDLPVVLASFDAGRINALADFDAAPVVKGKKLEMGSVTSLPDAKQVMSGRDLPTRLIQMIKVDKPKTGYRSSFLSKLGFELAEEGLNHLEIVSLLLHTDRRVKKFEGREDQLLRLTQIAELAMFRVLAEESIAVYSYDDILYRTKDLEWITNPWLPKSGSMILSSAPNVGKTQFALQMLSLFSLGKEFLGLPLDSSIQHSILFLSLEMPPEGLKYVLQKQVSNLPQRPTNFHFITEEASLTHYENLIYENKTTILLVDSLTELMDSLEGENDIVKAKASLRWCKKIQRRYRCSVILIHHNRKATEGNKKPKGLADLAGTFNFGRYCDTVIQLWEDSKGIEVSSVKCRYGPKEAFYTSRDPNTLWFTRDVQEDQGRSSQTQSRDSELSSVSVVQTVLPKQDPQIHKHNGELGGIGFGPEPVQSDQKGTGVEFNHFD